MKYDDDVKEKDYTIDNRIFACVSFQVIHTCWCYCRQIKQQKKQKKPNRIIASEREMK